MFKPKRREKAASAQPRVRGEFASVFDIALTNFYGDHY
jgi:hypothetical protein